MVESQPIAKLLEWMLLANIKPPNNEWVTFQQVKIKETTESGHLTDAETDARNLAKELWEEASHDPPTWSHMEERIDSKSRRLNYQLCHVHDLQCEISRSMPCLEARNDDRSKNNDNGCDVKNTLLTPAQLMCCRKRMEYAKAWSTVNSIEAVFKIVICATVSWNAMFFTSIETGMSKPRKNL